MLPKCIHQSEKAVGYFGNEPMYLCTLLGKGLCVCDKQTCYSYSSDDNEDLDKILNIWGPTKWTK